MQMQGTRGVCALRALVLHRDRPVKLMIYTRPVVHMSRKQWPAELVLMGTVNGCGYDGQQKDAICDVRGPCQTIQSTFKPVFFADFGYLVAQMPRCQDLTIFVVINDNNR